MGCNGGCNKNPCACNVVPLPYYEDPCYQQNQCQGVEYVVQYTPVLKIATSWAVPEFGQVITLRIPGLVDMMIGAVLSNPDYGDYEVVSFDPGNQSVKVQKMYYNDILAGTTVMPCTKFILVSGNQISYLSDKIDVLEEALNALVVVVDNCCGET